MAAFRFVKVFLILFVIWFPFNFLRLKVNIDVSSLKDLRNRYLLTISTTFEGRRLLPVRDISEGRALLCHLCFMSDDVKVFSFLSEEFLARPSSVVKEKMNSRRANCLSVTGLHKYHNVITFGFIDNFLLI